MADIPLAEEAPYFGGKKTFKIWRKCPNCVGYSPCLENIMSDLKTKFELAAANSKNLSERPDNTTLLKIYALYKQASVGDNADKKPGFGDMVGRAKWDAWTSLKGTIKEDAMQQYIDLIESLS
jgi:acyl-CoA-binding protein